MTNVRIKLTEFSDLITRYTADFVGREWLAKQVNALLDDPGCRFVVLTGGPGVGKTAFLAHLAATHPQWPRYFIRRDSRDLLRPGDANTFLLTIGGQLATLYPHLFHPENLEVVVRQRIGSVAAGGEATAVRIDELRASPFYSVALRVEQEIQWVAGKATAVEISRLVSDARLLQMQDLQYLGLLDPARLLAQTDPEVRIVVLVDALDELRYSPAEPDILRVLRALPEVPSNLRFVISSRPEAFLGRLLSRSDAHELLLDVAGVENQADLRAYTEGALACDGLEPALAEEGLSPEAFVEGLLDKAAGNFLYLKSVLGGIQEALVDPAKRDRLRRLLRVEELPDGLGALYGYFLASIVDWVKRSGFGDAAWRRYLSPFLGVLAVAQEPLSEGQLIGFTELEPEDIRDLLRELSQFVETVDGGQAVYRIYHTSFAEYLLDSERNRHYWIDGQKAHRRSADYYLNAWAGLEAWLPGLQEPEKWELDGGYGLRHVVVHLVQAEGVEDALSIIKPGFREAKRVHLGTDLSFVRDLEVILGYLEERGQADGLPATIRCSLIHSLLTNLMDTLPPEVLSALVWFGESDRALELATLPPDSEEKVARFLAIAQALRQSGADAEIPKRILQEALRTTRSLTRVAEGTQDLLRVRVAKQVAHLDWDWSQRILGEIEHPYIRAQSKMAVAAEVAEDETRAIGLLREVLPTITGSSPLIWDFSIALGKAAQHHLGAIQSLIKSIGDQCLQDLVRREVAKQLLENNACHLALSIAEEIRKPTESMTVLGHIASCLAEENVEEAYRVLEDISPAEKGSRALLDCIGALSPEHAGFALNIANRIVDASERCRALAQTDLLFARAHDIDKAQAILKSVRNIADQLPPSDVSLVFLLATIGETIAEIALVDEGIAREMIAEWQSIKDGQYIANSICRLLLDRDAELTLRLAELITHPYLKGILLARAVFRLTPDDPRVLTLRGHIRELMKVVTDEECRRQLQAYLLASEGVDTPERLLSIWEKEPEPGVQETGFSTEIVIGPSGVDYPASEDTEQSDDVLIGLALDVAHRNADQALVVLHAVLDHNRQIRGLAQMARLLSGRIGMTDLDDEGQASRLRHRNSLIDDVSVACGQLVKHDVQLASRIVEAIPDRSEQSRAYAAMALSLRDRDFDQAQLFLERALAVGQARPESALRTMAYLELDRCIPEESQEVDLVKKALSSLPVDSIPAAVPEVTRHIVTHLAAKGKEEVALDIAERMPATHTLLDIPDKMRALLGIAEHAIERKKPSVGKEALDAALDILRLSSYEAPLLPRLASLMHHYDPALAEQLFDNAVEIAMSRQMYGPSRFQILGGVARFRAAFNVQAALDAARKISDPSIRANALMSAVTRGNIPVEKKPEVIAEVQALLASDSGDAIAKGRALLKLVDTGAPERLNPRDLLWNVAQTARLAQPADWFKRIGLLTEIYHLFEDLGDQKAAERILSEALDTARNDPFNRAVCTAQVARLYLSRDRSRAILILYEILRRARLEGYDAVWTAITAIISVMCKVGGNTLAQHVYEELNIAEEFLSD